MASSKIFLVLLFALIGAALARPGYLGGYGLGYHGYGGYGGYGLGYHGGYLRYPFYGYGHGGYGHYGYPFFGHGYGYGYGHYF